MMPTMAKGKHPVTKSLMCTFAMRNCVAEAMRAGDADLATSLKKTFGFKKDLVLRAEHAFYHRLNQLVPELRASERVLDESVLRLAGKRKRAQDERPDYFHCFGTFALHGEFDETPEHEDCDERLARIAVQAGCGGRTYVFRVRGYIGTSRAVAVRRTTGCHVYYSLTEEGERVVRETAEVVRERLVWIDQGLVPDGSRRPAKTYINK
jgi:hypothetical protein